MSDFFDLDDDLTPPAPTQPTKPTPPAFLDALNPEQHQAVEQTEGPLLVLSGAGTGKTRVLTTRIAYILAMNLARPWQVLAVTFTNKASREMKERLAGMIGSSAHSVWLGTFHAMGIRILTRWTTEAGLNPNFIVLNTDDQERILKQLMELSSVDVKRYPPGIMLDVIQRWKDRGLAPTDVTRAEDTDWCEGRAKGFYQLYQNRLRELNAVDFGDLLLLPLLLFKNHPEILATYQDQFHYILVDEYQDTNVAQYMLLRLLAQKHRNICCVGDDDQSIYSWRGAEVENILKFQEIYPDAKVIRLERNYRSTVHILGAASGLISHNEGRLGKTLKVANDTLPKGDKVSLRSYYNGYQEAQHIVAEIESEQGCGIPLSQMAILVRTSAQTRLFEEELIKAGLPYKIIGGFKFYEREEIRDAVAYLRLVLNTNDDLAFSRIVNKPRRGIGDGALASLAATAKEKKISLFDAIAWAELRPSVRKTLDVFMSLVKSWQDARETLEPTHLARRVLEESGYMAMWRADKSPDAEGRIENLREFYNVLNDFETINAFIEYAALITDADADTTGDQLVVMTLHASKGLEFTTVFLPGWEEGLFPHQKALDDNGDLGLEEERRLAYVGLTRARQKAFVSLAHSRRLYGKSEPTLPSRFIDELPAEHIANHIESNLGYDNYDRFSYRGPSFESMRRYEPEPMPTWGQTTGMFNDIIDRPTPKQTTTKNRRIGKRVYHETFGYGIVIREQGDMLEISFDGRGIKKVMARFVRLT